MKVFIAWGGRRGGEVASAIHSWLPNVLQSARPFVAPQDIELGARWDAALTEALKGADCGLLCLTSGSLSNCWLHFEAGALWKAAGTSRVCPILFGVNQDVVVQPLAGFQAVSFSQEGMRKVVEMLNGQLALPLPSEKVNGAFGKWWPDLEKEVADIMRRTAGDEASPTRSVEDVCAEILVRVRQAPLASDVTAHLGRIERLLARRDDRSRDLLDVVDSGTGILPIYSGDGD